ncbi:hypothetical protein ACOSP7_007647 [Xanthoceras sorbifolium]
MLQQQRFGPDFDKKEREIQQLKTEMKRMQKDLAKKKPSPSIPLKYFLFESDSASPSSPPTCSQMFKMTADTYRKHPILDHSSRTPSKHPPDPEQSQDRGKKPFTSKPKHKYPKKSLFISKPKIPELSSSYSTFSNLDDSETANVSRMFMATPFGHARSSQTHTSEPIVKEAPDKTRVWRLYDLFFSDALR